MSEVTIHRRVHIDASPSEPVPGEVDLSVPLTFNQIQGTIIAADIAMVLCTAARLFVLGLERFNASLEERIGAVRSGPWTD
jgi:hypothetical protein